MLPALQLSDMNKTLAGLQTAMNNIGNALTLFARAVTCLQRRMRRRAARSGGRRHARSVGPWGLSWHICRDARRSSLLALLVANEPLTDEAREAFAEG